MNTNTLQLLTCLREDSREKLTSISKKTGIPISTLFDILKEIKGNLVIRNTVLIDFVKLGFNARAQILIKVKKECKEDLRKHLFFQEHINNRYKINSGWDFMIETIHKNIIELDQFLEKLTKDFEIIDYQIFYLIDEVKREGFVLT
ncbi:MAG: Lrp/AsnC family transcriptional regulator [Nanoarchaeota archaeon]|nr:Lrp/AsnC family transcriptional regulator [Nanoarchaeota archaeon]MBU1976655.1 Lrp/AsnC family transcriptional regulator [Nanoarchaeota archaeon]